MQDVGVGISALTVIFIFPITLSRTVLDFPKLLMVKRPEYKLVAAVLYTFGHLWGRRRTFRR
jgi:hypothetical protein